MDTIGNLIVYIRQYVELQASLLDSFKQSFPDVSDWEFLIDAPKSGRVDIDGDSWSFHRHGAGLSFQSGDGLTIDAHKHLSVPEGVDAWRLLQYIESIPVDGTSSLSERLVGKELDALKDKGELSPTQYEGLYRLAA